MTTERLTRRLVEELVQESLKKSGLVKTASSSVASKIDSETEMTPGEYDCLQVITQARTGDILKLIPDMKRDSKFVYIEDFERTEMLCTNPMMPQNVKDLCAKIHGFFLDVYNINPASVVISPISINLSTYKKVEKSSIDEFIQFHKDLCLSDIEQEKKLMRSQIAHSKKLIREKKELLKSLSKK